MTSPLGPRPEPPRPAPRGLRGVALVEHVVEEVTSGRIPLLRPLAPGKVERRDPTPLTATQIAALRLVDDKPISPSLARWLAFDVLLLPEIIGDPSAPQLEPKSLQTLVAAPFADEFATTLGQRLPGALYPLTTGSESTWVLYVGEPDATGEYPVLELRCDDTPSVALVAPGFDVWLATRMRVLDLEGQRDPSRVPSYAAAMDAQAHANLGGERFLERDG